MTCKKTARADSAFTGACKTAPLSKRLRLYNEGRIESEPRRSPAERSASLCVNRTARFGDVPAKASAIVITDARPTKLRRTELRICS